jgi:predicted enzyme related to lactoylglutathione lyase
MPTETAGAPCWIELFTADTDEAAAFYGALFGWTATEPSEEFGGYRMFLRDGLPIAGLMKNDGSSGGPSTWSTYLAEAMTVGDLGRMAVLVDPAGAMVGAWEALSFPGTMAHAVVGAPSWFENLTQDYGTALDFYRDVFDWDLHTMSDTDDFKYSTLGENENARAGIMDAVALLGDQPSRWQFYIQVADTDATVAAAVAAGGTVAMKNDNTPYGRLALLADPAGLLFAVMGPNVG